MSSSKIPPGSYREYKEVNGEVVYVVKSRPQKPKLRRKFPDDAIYGNKGWTECKLELVPAELRLSIHKAFRTFRGSVDPVTEEPTLEKVPNNEVEGLTMEEHREAIQARLPRGQIATEADVFCPFSQEHEEEERLFEALGRLGYQGVE